MRQNKTSFPWVQWLIVASFLGVVGALVVPHFTHADTLSQPIANLFPTGVDDALAPLAGGDTDPHYVVDGTGPAYLMSAANCFVSRPTPVTGNWITYVKSWDTSGTHSFSIYFTLKKMDISTAQISGEWTCGHAGTVLLNGQPTGNELGPNHFNKLYDFRITAGFKPGRNKLEFRVAMDKFDGLLVSEITGTVVPSSLMAPQKKYAGIFAHN